MQHPIKSPKKLIEVALPLDDINREAAREKSIRHGHPSTLHLWWARRPLAAARAVIFAQLVNDPSWKWEMAHPGEVPPGHLKGSWAAKRKQLFTLISELVKWENTNNEELLTKARAEIRKSWKETCELNKDHPEAATLFDPEKLPGLHDPFAGGGAIPLEAQRLGLDAVASDLNPVAVLINKAMIEIPPKFAGNPPVHPDAQQEAKLNTWTGAQGLAEDVRRYGAWLREEAKKRIGHLYPKVEITAEMAKGRPTLRPYVDKELTVIAWLWTRTVKCPNPACGCEMPLLSSFVLASKKGKEAFLHPKRVDGHVAFEISSQFNSDLGNAKKGYKRGTSGIFECFNCGTVTSRDYTAEQATSIGLGAIQTAVVCEGKKERIYLPPSASPWTAEVPEVDTSGLAVELAPNPRDVWCRNFGLNTPADLFIDRQLVTLTTLSDLVGDAIEIATRDAINAGLLDDGVGLEQGGDGAKAYAEALGVYLSFVVDKEAEALSTLCTWSSSPKNELVVSTFRRQALPMTWDFAESNPFASSSGAIDKNIKAVARDVETSLSGAASGRAEQGAAQKLVGPGLFVSTDPPYYDNIGYADLSDFFYVWLRRSLRSTLPSLFATMAVPKNEELVATAYRHKSNEKAEAFFLDGMTQALSRLAKQAHPAGPVTIYYAFKQSETGSDSQTSSTGWETFLGAVLGSGFSITGTWPMRTERGGRSIGIGTNALASSVVLVCRKRSSDAATISRRQFIRELNTVLPEALDEMTMGAGDDQSPVAPVDLSQSIIGPGMAVFSRYSEVLEADGTPMTVKTALQLINRFLAEDDFDADTQFCLRWFEQHGWNEGQYGEADVLARAKATSVGGVVDAGVLESGGGKVRLLRWADYPDDWDPSTDKRLPIWEALHQLIRAFKTDGESGSGQILGVIKDKTEAIRQLAYRLYTLCERHGWAEDARAYNELVTSWSAIETVANTVPDPYAAEQLGLEFGGEE